MVSIAENTKWQETMDILNAIRQDLENLQTAISTLTAKLDTDFAAQNAAVTGSQLDTDYATTCNPPSLNTEA